MARHSDRSRNAHRRSIQKWLVEKPSDWLSSLSLAKVWLTIAGTMLVGALLWFEAGDALLVLSMAAPEIVTWGVTFEVITLIDALAAVGLFWSSRQITIIKSWFMIKVLKTGGSRNRARKQRAIRTVRKLPANDDDGADRWAAAA